MLKKIYNKLADRDEYALVSVSDPEKILKWFGKIKPSEEAVQKEENRIEMFKHMEKRS